MPNNTKTTPQIVKDMVEDRGYMAGKTTSAEVAILSHAPGMAKAIEAIAQAVQRDRDGKSGNMGVIQGELEKLGYHFA